MTRKGLKMRTRFFVCVIKKILLVLSIAYIVVFDQEVENVKAERGTP